MDGLYGAKERVIWVDFCKQCVSSIYHGYARSTRRRLPDLSIIYTTTSFYIFVAIYYPSNFTAQQLSEILYSLNPLSPLIV